MRQKMGFTITELLITVGIIGVLAALSLPTLTQKAGAKKACASLARFDNLFSNAMETFMVQNGVSTLSSELIVPSIMGLNRYLDMAPYEGTYSFYDGTKSESKDLKPTGKLVQNQVIIDYIMQGKLPEGMNAMDLDLNNDGLINMSDVSKRIGMTEIIAYKLKDNSIMLVTPISPSTRNFNSIGNMGNVRAEILIDINGDNGDNIAGKDVFGFLLTSSGILIPAGSSLQKTMNARGTKNIGNAETTCSLTSSNIKENLACTGRYADNGWKTDGLNLR